MKRKINAQLVTISLTAVFITFLFVVIIFYNFFQNQIMEQLKWEADLLAATGITAQTAPEGLDALDDEAKTRLTLIAADGTVLWDSVADASAMENHGERPEVAEAQVSGTGTSIRRSYTLEETTYYYAKLLDDGTVLRLAKESDSIVTVGMQLLPAVLGSIVLLILLCLVFARIMTKKLVAPINEVADHLDDANILDTPYTEMMPFLEKIREQHADLIKSSKMRRDFTANVSHELKTPLTAISGYAELIEHGMANEEDTVRFASEIHRNADRLLSLINDILQLSRLDQAGEDKEQVAMERLDLDEIASGVVSNLQISAKKHQVSLVYQGEQAFVTGNRGMLEEVVQNLCDNGIRYNRSGGKVWVNVKSIEENVYLSVRDNGIGIPKSAQEHVFERFYRVDKSRSKASGGTGLGLAIVKHIASIHHAKIELESEAGEGTEITLRFAVEG
ncbi:MAG: ATP-binding protein [Lachnospiraceae bacterium]|nr:ATP-binding protein [Lachnospiraceae bacterium]